MKLISTNQYLLLIDEEAEIRQNDYYYNISEFLSESNGDVLLLQHINEENIKSPSLCKCISYYPLTKEVKELDLPLLPNPSEISVSSTLQILKDLVENVSLFFGTEVANRNSVIRRANKHIEDHKVAQSKQFSLEDMKYCWLKACESESCTNLPEFGNFEEFLQSLSTQQLPKEFILGEGNTIEEQIKNGYYKY